ncbi:hypothetical protein LEL_00923 [Akanthomyces lecanii RCEF 1005]|uniref:Uncharacterized protein n=1 Tax=Akanthomyces lecanii RCEF 1005 TaxID=1081108 RepID=A0A162KXQ2_CORDF|nr:hypothetical protein LEL_00923 [Akanthomyces lecanii RCEF 1005]
MAAMQSGTNEPPSISFSLAISPLVFARTPFNGDGDKPQITVTAVSHASSPITIFTWPTIFNLQLSQRRHNFTCKDVATDELVWMHLTKGLSRRRFSRTKGNRDEQYFVTLQPEVPYTVTSEFKLASRPLWTGEDESGEKYTRYFIDSAEGVLFLDRLESGHEYHFSVQKDESIQWWWIGTTEDVLAPKGTAAGWLPPSGAPIPVKLDQGVVFKIT